ncbi:MAG: phosphoenolpyruvate--protein phosphotransferase [Clostridia bacterium]|nr:phosphoenolpyruvate--protein phosphotransferase [Clostridia bacterium]
MDKFTLEGVSVSEGIGIGEIFILQQENFIINRSSIKENQINEEIAKLELAIDRTLYEICDLRDELRNRLERQESLIFEAYKSILEDRYFIQEIKDIIHDTMCFADNAVDICIKGYIKAIEDSHNDYAKQSIYDLNDICTRIIKNLNGEPENKGNIEKIYHKQIVVLKQLTPSIAAILGKKKVMGIVADGGISYLSHAAIILRGLGIPALSGIKYDEANRFKSKMAVIDGGQGKLIINPLKPELDHYREILKNNIRKQRYLFWKKNKPAMTKDEHRITLSANINSIEECDVVLDNRADGIGLVRTEILFINHSKMPNEKEQFAAYTKIAKKLKDKPVIIRTMDVGGDKVLRFLNSESNLSHQYLRGLERSLANKEEITVQIRSIIRATEYGNISMTFPMVNRAGEIKEVKEMVETIRMKLSDEYKKAFPKVRLGAFIETLSSLRHLDEILQEVDFISIGTNDLLQEFLARDRKSQELGNSEYLHPDFIRMIKGCIEKACHYEKHVTVCGEMASDVRSSVILLGIGATDLSVHPLKISKLRESFRKITMEEAKNLASRVIKSSSIEGVRKILTKSIGNG